MQQALNLRARFSILFAAVVVLASSGTIGSAAAEEPVGPAKVGILSGDVAALLRIQNHPAQPVLVAGAGENVVAIVFDEDPQNAAALPDELFSTDPVENCVGTGPVACCDSNTGMMVLSATYGGENGWLQMGELCTATKANVDFVAVPEEVSRELNARFGIDYCFMELADAEGNPRVLVNAPSSDSPLWAYCFIPLTDAEEALRTLARAPEQADALWRRSSIMPRAVLRSNPAIIPATHVVSSPPPPKTQSAEDG